MQKKNDRQEKGTERKDKMFAISWTESRECFGMAIAKNKEEACWLWMEAKGGVEECNDS